MKATGIVRKIDDLGRVVIPVEVRRVLGMEAGSSVEIFMEENMIVLRAYRPGCHACDDIEDLHEYHGIRLCAACLAAFERKGATDV